MPCPVVSCYLAVHHIHRHRYPRRLHFFEPEGQTRISLPITLKLTTMPDIQLLHCSVDPDDISEFRILVDGRHVKYLTIDAGLYTPDDMCFAPSLITMLPPLPPGDWYHAILQTVSPASPPWQRARCLPSRTSGTLGASTTWTCAGAASSARRFTKPHSPTSARQSWLNWRAFLTRSRCSTLRRERTSGLTGETSALRFSGTWSRRAA